MMGVSGSGKSHVGQLLAAALGLRFLEGDHFHSTQNVAKMAAGLPLSDADRVDWLHALQRQIMTARATHSGLVLSCSALKRSYRDILRTGDPALRFVHLTGDRDLIASRMAARKNHYMHLSLLDSQFALLEPLQADENGVELDICSAPHDLVKAILAP